MMKIALVTTGGTIDKDYFDALSDYKVVESIVPMLLERIGSGLTIERKEVCRKDSLELTEQDRDELKRTIIGLEADKVLVTHGTDTMVDSALSLGQITDKTIVFTGAMRPARFMDTDALFNVGVAIGALQSKESGVFVAMSGQVFSPDSVKKNRDAQLFESTKS
ncbi:asparaginase [Oleiphilus sp. HI0071]|jgi:L-asparaginase|uniref:asparaginase domain-containing protein n=1 Tax=unclassified Oleiphilus TaxID=2631174 RepID=UPI0007C3498F|nr:MULTISPECIES: asparaginase domain-containing protein [unclassified Oleiphilus]KZY70486.1 asparaginase [Oleiphilus sp. HI0065]KZY82058.1 asparaginase [Oleiphilus sp. HI0071]KZY91188.1 asparaginase [Oleiphilus sp. HI0073]KZZ40957.1 asparaginase [Oleiphilus sp. HI0118]KZZ50616.1 asparaginase [Oleiphilus sp. HI0122]KZZ77567.1 asparaginase [Oleiphilus sp. HI0130]KZZ81847.1 asparaginase [Oleiphilus sp. HI0133]